MGDNHELVCYVYNGHTLLSHRVTSECSWFGFYPTNERLSKHSGSGAFQDHTCKTLLQLINSSKSYLYTVATIWTCYPLVNKYATIKII